MANSKTKWIRTISAVKPDKPRVVAYETRTPFDVMCAKGQLDRDPRVNSLLHSAGTRYFADWRNSGMEPISAMSYDRVGGGSSGSAPGFMPASERQMIYRQAYRSARESMGHRYAVIVEPIVLEGRTSADVAKETEYTAKQYARMAVRERLTAGLMCLARHYKIASL